MEYVKTTLSSISTTASDIYKKVTSDSISISPADYKTLTDRKVESFHNLETKWKEYQKLTAEKMKIQDHLDLIACAIWGNAGSEYLSLEYSPPVDKSVLETLKDLITKAGWYVIIQDEALVIRNYAHEIDSNPDYDNFSYLRHKMNITYDNDKFEIDGEFDFTVHSRNDSIETYIVMGEYIRVKMWNLKVPKEMICTASDNNLFCTRLPYFKIPK